MRSLKGFPGDGILIYNFLPMELITTRLFPLPNVVFFPKTALPLHIFEPRYRQLMRDALDNDRRMAIALLQPGWENDYYGNPPVHSTCCVGLVDTFEELQDGRFNLVLVGEQKIRIQKVLRDHPYRTVSGIPLRDRVPPGSAPDTALQRQKILELAMEYFKLRSADQQDYPELQALQYETLINSLATHLGFPLAYKQQLLELHDLRERGKQVARFLQLQIHEQSILRKFQYLSPKDPTWN